MQTCIYPIRKEQYTGNYFRRPEEKEWNVSIPVLKYKNVVNTEQEALEDLKRMNIEKGLPIKNRIYPTNAEGVLCVELRTGMFCFFDAVDLPFVQTRTWCAMPGRKTWYAHTSSNHEHKNMHIYLANPDGSDMDVDHFNKNGLDNRRANLRLATDSVQRLNCTLSKKNNSGHTGVTYQPNRERWVATWLNTERKSRCKTFSIKRYGEEARELCIAYRKQMEAELPRYRYALQNV